MKGFLSLELFTMSAQIWDQYYKNILDLIQLQ